MVSVLTLTDFDDAAPFFVEAERVLRPGGQLVVLSTHPCFVGLFVKMEGGSQSLATVHPGYGDTQRVFEGPGIGDGVRSRVGVRHVAISELLNKLVASGLRLDCVEELGSGTVPWLFAVIATKVDLWSRRTLRSPREVELTPAQRGEAERRLRKHESDPGEYSSWDEIKRRLEGQR
jgi:hypothetical protein